MTETGGSPEGRLACMDKVEELTGMNFFSGLKDRQEGGPYASVPARMR